MREERINYDAKAQEYRARHDLNNQPVELSEEELELIWAKSTIAYWENKKLEAANAK